MAMFHIFRGFSLVLFYTCVTNIGVEGDIKCWCTCNGLPIDADTGSGPHLNSTGGAHNQGIQTTGTPNSAVNKFLEYTTKGSCEANFGQWMENCCYNRHWLDTHSELVWFTDKSLQSPTPRHPKAG